MNRCTQYALAAVSSPRAHWSDEPAARYVNPEAHDAPAGRAPRPFAQGAPGRAGCRRDANGDDPLGMLTSLALVGAGVVCGFVLAVITGVLGALIRLVIG